jgi:hypothetical protein
VEDAMKFVEHSKEKLMSKEQHMKNMNNSMIIITTPINLKRDSRKRK